MTVLSSQIEGTESSLQDVLAAEAAILDPARPRDVGEVLNYVTAMNHGLARLAELPVSVRLIREIHEVLVQGVRGGGLTPGELRKTQNLDRACRRHPRRRELRAPPTRGRPRSAIRHRTLPAPRR